MTSRIYPDQKPWSRESAQAFLDMSGGLPGFEQIGEKQLDAAIALHRMLITGGIAYLADEVGMGKTYVALAVVALCRHLQPGFRVLYLAPSRNVMRKWHEREQPAFIRNNVRAPDMRVRGLGGQSPGQAVCCQTVDEWVGSSLANPTALDVFLTFSALSFPLGGDRAAWTQRVKGMAHRAGISTDLRGITHKPTFKNKASQILNQIIPYYDLVIVDEAHLLKNGASDRAQFLASAMGTPESGNVRRYGGALLLSGTPFDRDVTQLARQIKLFARPELGLNPHEQVMELAEARKKGAGWPEIQAGLKPFMVRRVQKLDIGGERLSRNQYRTEFRQEAGISLDDKTDPEHIKQRLFSAVIQKRLIDFLQESNGGRFPLAMFASWEAYTPPAPSDKSDVQRPDTESTTHHEAPPAQTSGELDVSHEVSGNSEGKALDSQLLSDLLASYRDIFDSEPPHPKLEIEAKRLSKEAFTLGLKQLVFVRRLKSVDDLYNRLNQAYDQWLVDHLGSQGCHWAEALRWARNRAQSIKSQSATAESAEAAGNDPEKDSDPEADSLFSWFFRGKLDATGEDFISQYHLPKPQDLRTLLRDPRRSISIIGELDWYHFLENELSHPQFISDAELAAKVAGVPGGDRPLDQYRRLQVTWLELQAESAPQPERRALQAIAAYTRQLLTATNQDRLSIPEKRVRELLDMPTVGLVLYQGDIGRQFLPAWCQCWEFLCTTAWAHADDEFRAESHLRNLDLQREVQFALLRLDHPFIDLYLAWLNADRQSDALIAKALVQRVVSLCQQADATTRFGTASILHNLAAAWEQIVKTNFSDMLHGSDRIDRDRWRVLIHFQLSPFAPIEFASGYNSDNRTAIARRFRMPGYPMALISTSVLQEGEDLHVCCDRVTHFGISGSPIGIEQKNGRVDRIGSRAHRRLIAEKSVECAGIQVSFPHLTESLEWYQIRELGIAINEYLRSLHEIGNNPVNGDQTITQSLSDETPIPPLLKDSLESPFEPDLPALPDCVATDDVTNWTKTIADNLEHARSQIASVAQEAAFTPTADPDCFVSRDGKARLVLLAAYLIGEIKVLAERRLTPDEYPDWLSEGEIHLEMPLQSFQKSMADPKCQHGLLRLDDGSFGLTVTATCFAHGDGQLHIDEIRDLLWRVGCLKEFTPPQHSADKFTKVLLQLKKSRNYHDFEVTDSPSPNLRKVRYRGMTITLIVMKSWVIATRPIESCPDANLKTIIDKTVLRNVRLRGPDFFLGQQNQIKDRMVHPLADLGVPELVSMIRELVALSRCR